MLRISWNIFAPVMVIIGECIFIFFRVMSFYYKCIQLQVHK
jgi:hypothetical protein